MRSVVWNHLTTHEGSNSESSGLIASNALSAVSPNEQCVWIVDSGATCHMCHDDKIFITLNQIEEPIEVMLGDEHALTATGRDEVVLRRYGITVKVMY